MTCVLVDTNVWISAFLAPDGHCGRLVHRLIGAAAADVVTSAPLVEELANVLERPRLIRRYGFTTEDPDRIGLRAPARARSPAREAALPRHARAGRPVHGGLWLAPSGLRLGDSSGPPIQYTPTSVGDNNPLRAQLSRDTPADALQGGQYSAGAPTSPHDRLYAALATNDTASKVSGSSFASIRSASTRKAWCASSSFLRFRGSA